MTDLGIMHAVWIEIAVQIQRLSQKEVPIKKMQAHACGGNDSGKLNETEELFCRRLLPSTKDWPKQGVTFLSIFPLLADFNGLHTIVHAFKRRYAAQRVTHVAGIDARGFAVGSPVAYALKVGFVMIRKSGKLPPPVRAATYSLEYGTSEVQIPLNAFKDVEESRVVIIDDLVATGGTMIAACQLLQEAGAIVIEGGVVVELCSLEGRENLRKEVHLNLHALIQYSE